ncbi:MAG: hypothetical protein JXX28_04735 [Deltaproteobacteria bacterium]|nr:hypothetical protein [Deltaproteobacteria bacterium]
MTRWTLFLTAAAALSGCGGDTYTYSGHAMDGYFPFDGERVWEFTSTNPDVPYKLVADLDTGFRLDEDGHTKIFTVEQTADCLSAGAACEQGALIRRYEMSADGTRGVLLWSYESPTDGQVTFDPPVLLAGDHMVAGTEVVTESVGRTYTSRFVTIEDCPVLWTEEWDSCVRLEVSATGDVWPAGTWWAITGWNIVSWQLASEEDQWKLLWADFSPLD